MSITAITIENFKGIADPVSIPIRPITLLFGKNSAGKSTLLQALHYLREVLEHRQPDPDRLIAYRHRWLDALFTTQQIEAVVTLGTLAAEAWQLWKATPQGQATTVSVAPITHPTQPESSSKGDKTKLAAAIKAMLQNWNSGLQHLAPVLQHPDQVTELVLYGETFQDGDRVPIPEGDLPVGLPAWMHEQDGWARRVGTDAQKQRANITITVPKGVLP